MLSTLSRPEVQTSLLPDLDLQPIMGKLVSEGLSNAAEAEMMYRRFLLLHQKYPNMSLVPNKLIDEVWHQHILFTQKYAEDCQMLFGSFLHHRPTFGLDLDPAVEVEMMQLMQRAYLSEFGEQLVFEPQGSDCGDKCFRPPSSF